MRFAAVFPGQGSQALGMLRALAEARAEVRETYREASDVLGFDLWALTQEGPEAALNATENTQPAMLAAGVAVWRAWIGAGGGTPSVMAGHSLGEYTALVCAGALEFADAVQLVAERGRRMQAAVPEGRGAMAAVLGLDDDLVRKSCADAANGQVVAAVNFNSPGQVVIAGEVEAVERAMQIAKVAGAKRVVKLPVSVPSHCELMRGAAEALRPALAAVSLSTPRVAVIHNADVATHTDATSIRKALETQLHQPVRWVETVQKIAADGVVHLVEFGPGGVLTGLVKRIDKRLQGVCVHDPASLEAAIAACMEA